MTHLDLKKLPLDKLKVAILAGSGLSQETLLLSCGEDSDKKTFAYLADALDKGALEVTDEAGETMQLTLNYDKIIAVFNPSNQAVHFTKNKNETAHLKQQSVSKRNQWARLNRFLNILELTSHVLPPKFRNEAFEPFFNEVKMDYLTARRRHKTKAARRWLSFCFAVHVIIIVGECMWNLCGSTAKRIILSLLPASIRKLVGG